VLPSLSQGDQMQSKREQGICCINATLLFIGCWSCKIIVCN